MSTLLVNKYLFKDYTVLDTFSAGLQLLGHEVKSLRAKHGSINESFVVTENGELFLVKAHIPPYQAGNVGGGYNPYRKRKLLLTKKELKKIITDKTTTGLTVVPKAVYLKGRLIKIDLVLVRSKNKRDKRQDLQKKDAVREIERTLKTYR